MIICQRKDNALLNKWTEIWSRKPVIKDYENETGEFEKFVKLKKANGFDVAIDNEEMYFKAFYEEWMGFYDRIQNLCGNGLENVYEVGCGSGVNLYMFENRNVVGGGCDYSQSMIETAKNNVRSRDLACCEASEINISPQYDVVMSESVFQYFESLEYADKVIRKMVEKSRQLVYIGEIHNKEYEEQLMEYRRKIIDNYDTKYAGLSKLFFEKSWFENIACSYGRSISFSEVDNPEYINGRYLFNCYIYE